MSKKTTINDNLELISIYYEILSDCSKVIAKIQSNLDLKELQILFSMNKAYREQIEQLIQEEVNKIVTKHDNEIIY